MNFEWYYKRLYWKVRKFLDVHCHIRSKNPKYYGKKILSTKESNEAIEKMILAGKPFAAGRIGGTELKAMIACQPEFKNEKEKRSCRSLLICLSGFYGEMDEFEQFGELMQGSLGQMDYIGVWFNQMEDYMIHHYGKRDMICGKLEGLEPWYCKDAPWSRCLKGKRVVCIHPFQESVLKQYEKRELLFPGTDILPEFHLRCIKAVQTLGCNEDDRFPSWFDALDYMYEETMREDFDIALIACGAYGLPLAARIKEAGKQAIHVGGALQLLFGIRGSRWDDFEPLKEFYSEAWKYPLESEQLKVNSEIVENGCYW